MKKILITGVAGFIGYFLARRLLDDQLTVVGIDNLNNYYDPDLKQARLARLTNQEGFTFIQGDLADRPLIEKIFQEHDFDVVVNLAAQAGVRYSLENPHSYVDSNVTGFLNVLEGCRHSRVKHLVFASSSSVYGGNTKLPYSAHDRVDHPVSLYAATKKADELMAHSYSHLYGIAATGLRFFTVYGPWGRPDMAFSLFTRAILAGEPINVFNHGDMRRDFTYISDIIEGVVRIMEQPPQPGLSWNSDEPDPAISYCPYRIYNIGNNNSEDLMRFIEVLEDCLGKKAEKNFLPMQPGDVQATYADISDLVRDTGFQPSTSIEEGLKKFVDWYKWYYREK